MNYVFFNNVLLNFSLEAELLNLDHKAKLIAQ